MKHLSHKTMNILNNVLTPLEQFPLLTVTSTSSSCFLGVLLFFLPAEVSLDLVPEEEHPQLAVRRLIHGLGLHAHAVLVRGQLVGAVLLVPQVEQAA